MLKLRELEDINQGSNMIKKCLFPAAGYGTRFLPATKSMPKEMMPVVNKPLIEYGVEEAIQAGMDGMFVPQLQVILPQCCRVPAQTLTVQR